MKQEPRMIIVVGPSGAGKSSFVDRAVVELPILLDTITNTTRSMRGGESEGNPYYFVDRETFKKRIEEDYFVEWAEVHGNLYGTPKQQIDEGLEAGRVIIMDVDVQGARTFKSKYPFAKTIFIAPPSVDALRQRLVKRDGAHAKDMELRLENAIKELALTNEFDIQLINDNFETSYIEFKKIVEDIVASS